MYGRKPRWSSRECARTTPIAKPIAAPSAEPDGGLLRGEERRVPEHLDQERPVPPRRLEELADHLVRVRHRQVVHLNGQSSSVVVAEPAEALPETPEQASTGPGERELSARVAEPTASYYQLAVGRADDATSRTVEELRELRELTGDEDGAQRVAWTDTWAQAREWLRGKVAGTGVERGDRRGGEPVVHAARRLRPDAPDRRPHRLGPERRLARRLPERDGGRRGPAPPRRGRRAAADRSPRELG